MANEFKKMVEDLYEADPSSPTGYESPDEYKDPTGVRKDFEEVERMIQREIIPSIRRYFPKASSGWFHNGVYDTNAVGYGSSIDFGAGTISSNFKRNKEKTKLNSPEGQKHLRSEIESMSGEFKEAGPIVFLSDPNVFNSENGNPMTLQLDYAELLQGEASGMFWDEYGKFQEPFSGIDAMVDIAARAFQEQSRPAR